MSLLLRPYQSGGIDGLRAGFADGHKAQILYGPTGCGKTELAIAMLKAANDKGTRSAMVLDRIVLCNQTSARLDKYQIPHGVLQSGHWRYRPYERIQVCSAQTLEKRGSFPGLELLIIDEAHQTRKQTVEFVKAHPEVKVVGLTATPFTKGLGAVYTNVVGTATTEFLVGAGNLVPLRVFLAKQIDMTGAKKIAGEWSDKDAGERGVKITGDIVNEWIAKTHELFNGPRKTIVFCAGVAHGEDLARKFAEAGYNFVSVSYKDDDQFKADAFKEFAKPDSTIHGLIATDILTKGFDVSDVMVGISARPFTKSFSSHVQQLGRVMRSHPGKQFAAWLDHCIASGQRCLTQRGLVPIEQVLISDTLWDGHEFVAHKGVVSRGIRPVITYAGITGTPDHPVKTKKGWRTLGQCAEEQTPVVTTGVGRTTLWEREDHFTGCDVVGSQRAAIHALHLRVRHLRISIRDFALQLGRRAHAWLQEMQPAKGRCADLACAAHAINAPAMHEPQQQQLSQLRREGDRVQVRVSDYLRSLDHEELRSAVKCARPGARQEEQRRALRAGESSVGNQDAEHRQSTDDGMDAPDACVQAEAPGGSIRGLNSALIACSRFIGRANRGAVAAPLAETERQVWDVLDCGPRNSFTCEGLLVHNSGNYLRFRDEWEDLYTDGPGTLDDGKEKAKPEPTAREKKANVCPKCRAIFAPKADTCAHCGFTRVRLNGVVVLPGEMQELMKKERAARDDRQRFYSELMWIVQEHGYKPGWAFHKYREKYGMEPRGLNAEPLAPSLSTRSWIRSQQIRWAKSRQREGVAA